MFFKKLYEDTNIISSNYNIYSINSNSFLAIYLFKLIDFEKTMLMMVTLLSQEVSIS